MLPLPDSPLKPNMRLRGLVEDLLEQLFASEVVTQELVSQFLLLLIRETKLGDFHRERVDKRDVCRGPFCSDALVDIWNVELEGLESVFDQLSALRRVVLLGLDNDVEAVSENAKLFRPHPLALLAAVGEKRWVELRHHEDIPCDPRQSEDDHELVFVLLELPEV